MGTLEKVAEPASADRPKELTRIEFEREGCLEAVSLEIDAEVDPLHHVRVQFELDAEVLLFERDKDEAVTEWITTRRAFRLVAHRHKLLLVKVHYDHHTKEREFAPSKTTFKVLQWAIGKHGFDLDPVAGAKANLILPGADTPLPRDSAIGVFTKPGDHVLVVDLTLRDFTNG